MLMEDINLFSEYYINAILLIEVIDNPCSKDIKVPRPLRRAGSSYDPKCLSNLEDRLIARRDLSAREST